MATVNLGSRLKDPEKHAQHMRNFKRHHELIVRQFNVMNGSLIETFTEFDEIEMNELWEKILAYDLLDNIRSVRIIHPN